MTIHHTWHTLINISNIWNFNSLFRVCLIFYTYDSANCKKHRGITPWKKCYSLLRWPCLAGCAQQTFTVQNKPAASSTEKAITHHFFVSGIGQKKTVDADKICGGTENVVKTETQQTFVNGLLGFFITLSIILRWKRVCIAHNNYVSCPSIWATLSALLINILLGSFQLFLHSDQPLSEGEIIPVQRCLPVRGGCIIHAGAVVASHCWQTALICNRRPATSSRGGIIFGFAISLTPSCILHRAQQHHADASACQ